MIGIDVGGANLKVVDDRGASIHYCPLWEHAPLTRLLMCHRHGDDDPAAVVMSGELADCFSRKAQGISFIVAAVRAAFRRARFYGTDAAFHSGPVPQLAAANWLASADFLREQYPGAILVDIGSTTTDIIPLGRFDDLKGLTDLLRLQKGYLLYSGMLRTTLPSLLRAVEIDGVHTPVSAENFAVSADAHLVLGHIRPREYCCDTPDRKGKTKDAALRRLARVVCADVGEIGRAGAEGIARQFWDAQREIVHGAVRAVMDDTGASSVVTAGIGAQVFARELGGTDLSRELGPAAGALPALAVREIALRKKHPARSDRKR